MQMQLCIIIGETRNSPDKAKYHASPGMRSWKTADLLVAIQYLEILWKKE